MNISAEVNKTFHGAPSMVAPCRGCKHERWAITDGHIVKYCNDLTIRGRFAVIMGFNTVPDVVDQNVSWPLCNQAYNGRGWV